MWAKSSVMHSAFWLLATLLALTLESLKTQGQPNAGADIQKNKGTNSESVTQTTKHNEHGSDYNHKLSDEAKKSGGHHSKHKTFKSKKFHKHMKTTHKNGHSKGPLPQYKRGRIGKKKGKKKKVHKKRTHHKRTRKRHHKKNTKKHGKHCRGKKIYIKKDPFCQDKSHKNHCRWHNCSIHTFLTGVTKI